MDTPTRASGRGRGILSRPLAIGRPRGLNKTTVRCCMRRLNLHLLVPLILFQIPLVILLPSSSSSPPHLFHCRRWWTDPCGGGAPESGAAPRGGGCSASSGPPCRGGAPRVGGSASGRGWLRFFGRGRGEVLRPPANSRGKSVFFVLTHPAAGVPRGETSHHILNTRPPSAGPENCEMRFAICQRHCFRRPPSFCGPTKCGMRFALSILFPHPPTRRPPPLPPPPCGIRSFVGGSSSSSSPPSSSSRHNGIAEEVGGGTRR